MNTATQVRNFARVGDAVPIPNLIGIQTESYARFLQEEATPDERPERGLEALLREVFPIESYDGNLSLHYISYELGKPRYTPDECRQLRLTYGMPFRIRVRLMRKDKDEIQEDHIYGMEISMDVRIADGEVLKIDGTMKRYTNFVCPQAVPVLQMAVGMSLREDGWDRKVMREIGRQGCEHFAEIVIESGRCLDPAVMARDLRAALEADASLNQEEYLRNGPNGQ